MSNSDWISLSSAIATFLGVVVAAVAIWLQISKLNNQLLIQQFSEYTKRYQGIILNFPENINEPSFDFASDTNRDLTMRYMRAYFDLCFEEWYLNQRKLIDSETWKIWEGGMRTALSKTAFINAWIQIEKDTGFSLEFKEFLEKLSPDVSIPSLK